MEKNAENVFIKVWSHHISEYFLGFNGRLETVEIFVRKNNTEYKGTSCTVLEK